jgi:hypothetical protein
MKKVLLSLVVVVAFATITFVNVKNAQAYVGHNYHKWDEKYCAGGMFTWVRCTSGSGDCKVEDQRPCPNES